MRPNPRPLTYFLSRFNPPYSSLPFSSSLSFTTSSSLFLFYYFGVRIINIKIINQFQAPSQTCSIIFLPFLRLPILVLVLRCRRVAASTGHFVRGSKVLSYTKIRSLHQRRRRGGWISKKAYCSSAPPVYKICTYLYQLLLFQSTLNTAQLLAQLLLLFFFIEMSFKRKNMQKKRI